MNPKSIMATTDEIVQRHQTLGLPVDADEFCEAWAAICRIEMRLANNIEGDHELSGRKAG